MCMLCDADQSGNYGHSVLLSSAYNINKNILGHISTIYGNASLYVVDNTSGAATEFVIKYCPLCGRELRPTGREAVRVDNDKIRIG